MNKEKTKVVETQVNPEFEKKSKTGFLSKMQKLGKSLVYPIAILPAAALLLRIGVLIGSYGSIDGTSGAEWIYWLGVIISTPGDVVFSNLPLIFAVGIGFGFAKDFRGEAALVAGVGYFVLFGLVQADFKTSLSYLFYQNVLIDPVTGQSELLYLGGQWLLNMGVFGGILAGLVSAQAYNRYSGTRLHPALGFFSGRRFVPMVVLLVMTLVAIPMAALWPWMQYGLVLLSRSLNSAPVAAAGVFAFANRLLIPFGLHQVLNTYFWFQSPIVAGGSQLFILDDATGLIVPLVGDIHAFAGALGFINDGIYIHNGTTFIMYTGPEAAALLQQANVGIYQTGFFPIMMFGLPAVGIAIAMKADKDKQKAVWAFVGSAILVSFITGITEPLEYTFMFISPVLYLVYAAISGGVAAATVATGASMGFGFSAGAIDFAISIPTTLQLSQGASSALGGSMGILWILIIGIGSMPLYWGSAMLIIDRAKVATPGRLGNNTGIQEEGFVEANSAITGVKSKSGKNSEKLERIAQETIDKIGPENFLQVDNCITRVRLKVVDNSKFKKEHWTKVGYLGSVNVGKQDMQLILGTDAEVVANLITEKLENIKHGAKPAPVKKTNSSIKTSARK